MKNPPYTIHRVELSDDALRNADAVVIITDHSSIDYQKVVDLSRVVVDTRNATAGLSRRGTPSAGLKSADMAIA